MTTQDNSMPMAADLYGELMLAAPTRRVRVRDYLPGLAVAGATALAAAWLSDHYGPPLVLMGLLLGLALSFVSHDARTHAGLDALSQTGLRLGIVLLGMKVTLSQLAALGLWPFALLIGIMAAVIGAAVWTAPWFRQSRDVGWLAGGATAICGASAALAIYGLLGKDRVDQTRFTAILVGITMASAAAMALYPLLAVQLQLTDVQAGFLTGAAIHDVAQALGGGYTVSPEAGGVATVVKLARVALLAPLMLLLALWLARANGGGGGGGGGAARLPLGLPWFIIAFAGVMTANSLLPVPPVVRDTAATGAQILLTLAIVSTAMKARLQLLVGQGWRSIAPIVVASATSFCLALAAAMTL